MEYTYGQPVKRVGIATYSPERTCSAPGCSTKLSIYNATEYCSLHERYVPRNRPSPKRG
jgi:hypothetical protein